MIVLAVLALLLIVLSLLWRRQAVNPGASRAGDRDVFITVSDSAWAGDDESNTGRSERKRTSRARKRKPGAASRIAAPRDPLSETIPVRGREPLAEP